jgi:hypothetical protein
MIGQIYFYFAEILGAKIVKVINGLAIGAGMMISGQRKLSSNWAHLLKLKKRNNVLDINDRYSRAIQLFQYNPYGFFVLKESHCS